MKRPNILFVFLLAICMAVSGLCLTACSDNNYEPELKSPTIQPPTIGEAGKLRVGVNTDKSPLAGLGNDKIIGIDVDIAAALADELGLELNIVDVGSSPESAISSDKVDLVLGIDNSDTISDFWISNEYLPAGIALFALTSTGATVPSTEEGAVVPKIAAQVSSKSAWAVTNDFGAEALVSTPDLATAFKDLQSGEVDFVAADAIIGMYAANRAGVNVEAIALLENANGYCAGVSSSNTDLQSAVSDSLSKLKSNGTIDVIEMKWLGNVLNLSNVEVITAKNKTTTNVDEEGEDAQGGALTDTSNTSNTTSNTTSSSNN